MKISFLDLKTDYYEFVEVPSFSHQYGQFQRFAICGKYFYFIDRGTLLRYRIDIDRSRRVQFLEETAIAENVKFVDSTNAWIVYSVDDRIIMYDSAVISERTFADFELSSVPGVFKTGDRFYDLQSEEYFTLELDSKLEISDFGLTFCGKHELFTEEAALFIKKY